MVDPKDWAQYLALLQRSGKVLPATIDMLHDLSVDGRKVRLPSRDSFCEEAYISTDLRDSLRGRRVVRGLHEMPQSRYVPFPACIPPCSLTFSSRRTSNFLRYMRQGWPSCSLLRPVRHWCTWTGSSPHANDLWLCRDCQKKDWDRHKESCKAGQGVGSFELDDEVEEEEEEDVQL